jgi:DNA polymerase III delta prime subunit
MLPRIVSPTLLERMPPGVRLREIDDLGLDKLVVNAAQRKVLQRWALGVNDGYVDVPLVVAGHASAGRATAARAASASVGRAVVECAWSADRADRVDRVRAAAREAVWRQATLLVRVSDGPHDPDVAGLWAALTNWELPLALAVPAVLAEAVCAAAPREPALVSLEGTTIEQRARLWGLLLAANPHAFQLTEPEQVELAARYDFAPGILARAVRRASAECALAGRDEPLDFERLARACRAVGSAGMGPIAQQLPQPYTRDDLVLPQHLLDELDLASAWIQQRRRVFEEWGFGRRVALGQGLTALFSGPPGTGKTMAAQVLAHELGLDLFRVDLSRVMSKYIGETEKNLSQLFDDARASGAILFFDEADALFGKRSEVKDAHDRYANVEIGYLLQRMEEHTGTTVLATNRVGDLDEAFTRRFHFILDFPMPGAGERRRIWDRMLPAEAAREPTLNLDGLARDHEVSGGDIRNAVLAAAFIAAAEGAPIGVRHLKRGLRRELLKNGRVLDSRQRQALEGD